jgi:hypothetical protein
MQILLVVAALKALQLRGRRRLQEVRFWRVPFLAIDSLVLVGIGIACAATLLRPYL